ncbi:hypothetical protein Q4S17_18300, partial [Morganella morganii]
SRFLLFSLKRLSKSLQNDLAKRYEICTDCGWFKAQMCKERAALSEERKLAAVIDFTIPY